MAKNIASFLLLLLLLMQDVASPSVALGSTTLTVPPTEELLQRVEMPWRDLSELAARMKGVPREASVPGVVGSVPERKVGDVEDFWVSDEDNSRYYQVRAVLQVVAPHVYMYVADGARVNLDKLREAARFFEEQIYSANGSFFGHEARVGLDGDPHVTILHADIPGVAGYFTSVDTYPRAVQPYSNERKMLYINIDAVQPGSSDYYSVLAHEFEHMVHWHTDRLEQTWVKEGAAEVATEAIGLPSSSSEFFESKPDTQLTGWIDSKGDSAPHYGAAYLFLSYFLGRFGGYGEAAELLTSDTRGLDTFDRFLAKIGRGLTVEDVFKDWVVANYLDERGVNDPRYCYDKQSVRVQPTDRVTTSTGWRDRTVNQFAADYIEIEGKASNTTFRFQGERAARVIPTAAHSGTTFWWSNRGDLVDTKLTHFFDLRTVDRATMNFWTWYDLEDGFDYAYVSVSKDGGLTWSILPAAGTTSANPNGNNLGQGFTGNSGGGKVPVWVRQSVDLTPYVGDIVLVRFEMVTDDAYNAPGFAVDDIEVPELGYRSDVETGNDGWFSDGFIRTDGKLAQRFSLRLIRFGREITVEDIPVAPSGEASVVLQGTGSRTDRVVVVVSALTRYTSEPASYRYIVEMAP